ncbi:FAD-binding oxidoreductase [Actinomadura rubrisoli]|uniref:FAD-binding oxidoreductase n=1 Tax=Actinomadura rubrisoli TaxID=2530368 RepID=A0A4R5BNX2_9ACTN|nr:FAD-dependent oxidoreductase [Actinomadura rubrisoli]TDD87126.1 FAD-binding oxidoreductase [Actinomadura rubrisoli]
MSTDTLAVAKALAGQIAPRQIYVPGNGRRAAYGEIWNKAVTNRPLAIVRCRTAAEVSAVIRVSRALHLPLSVLGGGHDWAGRALRDHGVVIDLSTMRGVAVDPVERVATVSGGATSADVMDAGAPRGLVTPGGTVGEIGVAGILTGGGYGPLSGRFGLVLDNLLSAEVVLADGRRVVTDATREPDLFWALRGGGGNFGVVTSMRVRMHPLDALLVGFLVFPWSQASDVLQGFAGLLPSLPDELTVQSGVLPDENGEPTLFLSPAWSGPLEDGARYIDKLQSLGTPLSAQVGPMSYPELLRLFDSRIVPGRHYAIRTRTVATLGADVNAALIEAGIARTSAASFLVFHHFHGAPGRVPLESTAFGIRREHVVIEIIASWEPDDRRPERHRAWADRVSASLKPLALPGGYANLLGPDDHEQIAHAYGPNTARLLAAKTRYDPDGVFTAIPLPTSTKKPVH